jgi:hypothetical protein
MKGDQQQATRQHHEQAQQTKQIDRMAPVVGERHRRGRNPEQHAGQQQTQDGDASIPFHPFADSGRRRATHLVRGCARSSCRQTRPPGEHPCGIVTGRDRAPDGTIAREPLGERRLPIRLQPAADVDGGCQHLARQSAGLRRHAGALASGGHDMAFM